MIPQFWLILQSWIHGHLIPRAITPLPGHFPTPSWMLAATGIDTMEEDLPKACRALGLDHWDNLAINPANPTLTLMLKDMDKLGGCCLMHEWA